MLTQPSDLKGLSLLGGKGQPDNLSEASSGAPSEATLDALLEAFPNRSPERFYLVTLETSEFTCLCPMTGQPDFARIHVQYVPDQKVVESKSLKLYLWSFRNKGAFHEHVINQILQDLVQTLDPHWCKVTGVFNVRGGIGITVEAEHTKTAAARQQWASSPVQQAN